MKRGLLGILVLALTFALPRTSSAQVRLIGIIPVPDHPIISSDITWVDPRTERAYLTDRSNFGVDIIDAENNVYVGRVGGMAGPLTSGGGTTTTNGGGPNGVLVTSNKILWAGDGNSTTTVADVDPNSPNYLSIIGQISTAIDECDTGDAHYCGRDDEIGYDPKHHIIMIANNGPLSPTLICPTPTNLNAHCPVDPYVTFISADPPYTVIGAPLIFPGASGIEQPLWDPGLNGGRFLLTVPGSLVNGIPPTIAIIDPLSQMVETTWALDCQALLGTTSQSITGIALGRRQHILVSACGAAPVASVPIILNARTGEVYNVVTEVGGGDEVWYNRGDNRFYVTGPDQTVTAGLQSLGVIDGATSGWLQNVTDVKGKNPSALPENNHVFTLVQITQAIVDDPSTDDSICAQFGFLGTGCIAVFGPEEND
jgi:hypothetical protein